MIGVPQIQELYRYNRWANGRLFDSAALLGDNDFTRGLASSYPSVRDTVTHIIWAEWIWLQRWKGTSPREVFDPRGFPNVERLKTRWLEISAEQHAFVDDVTVDQLAALAAYVNVQGETWRYPLWRQMYHVVNHSTYHRGQVTTMLRQLDAVPPSTDFLLFHDGLESERRR